MPALIFKNAPFYYVYAQMTFFVQIINPDPSVKVYNKATLSLAVFKGLNGEDVICGSVKCLSFV